MSKALTAVLALAFLITSWSCQRMLGVSDTQGVSTSSTPVTRLNFPQPWLDPMQGLYVQQIEVRKLPNSPADEFLFAGLPYGDNFYAHEVNKNAPQVEYAPHMFAVNFSAGPRVRVVSREEWESGSRIPTKPRQLYANEQNDSSGEIEYRQRRYSKLGNYWGSCSVSPTGKWIATFSYSGQKRPPSILFGGVDPLIGDVFWQVNDAITGRKVFEWQARNVKNPTRFDNAVVWLEERYFLFAEDDVFQNFNVVTLPPVTPEVNPVTIQFPSRVDATGRPLTPGASDEAWIPLSPLTPEQIAKLTARDDTDIKEVRVSRGFPQELLLAINEETENRRIERQQKDGGRDYHFRLIYTYYYALALDDPSRTRFASKEEWDHAQGVRTRRADGPSEPPRETVIGTVPPYRQFSKTGSFWGSPARLSADEWIAVFSYSGEADDRKLFVDVFDQRLGDKLMSTTLPSSAARDELLKRALWSDGGYILLPLNSSLDSFAFWRLP